MVDGGAQSLCGLLGALTPVGEQFDHFIMGEDLAHCHVVTLLGTPTTYVTTTPVAG